jgi:hypothetical protein
VQRQIQCPAGLGAGKEQSADEDVGVENAAQLGAFEQRVQNFCRKAAGDSFVAELVEDLL